MPVLKTKTTVLDIASELSDGDVLRIEYSSSRSDEQKVARGHVLSVHIRSDEEKAKGGITIVREDGMTVRAYVDGHIEVGGSGYTQGYVESIKIIGNCEHD